MNISIEYNEYDSKLKTKLKNGLIQLYPNKKEQINEVITNLVTFDVIHIINDNIKIYDYIRYINKAVFDIYFSVDEFIDCFDLLNEFNENTFALKINNLKEHEFLIEYFKNNNYICDCYLYQTIFIYIIDDKNIHLINNDKFELIFKSIKLIDSTTFIRNLKLNQLN